MLSQPAVQGVVENIGDLIQVVQNCSCCAAASVRCDFAHLPQSLYASSATNLCTQVKSYD